MTAPAPKKIETIPADVATDLDCIRWYVECLDAVAFKRRAVAGLAEAEGSYNAAMKRLTDRDTRPAEPAAPVAEAGDGDVAASLAHLNIGYLYGIADALEHTDFTRASDIRQCLLQVVKGLSVSAATLEAERARAAQAEADLHEVEEQFAKLQEAEAQAEEEACLRVAAEASLSRVLQDRDFWKERFQVESRSRIQAEQRAAEALVRAEKAEDWQPIETAKAGELLLLFEPHSMGGFIFVGALNGVWFNNLDQKIQQPTMWRPLPAPPRDLSQGGQHG